MKYGRYEIVEALGRGTMGEVHKAHDPQIDRMVALKVLRADRVVSQEFVMRFMREAKAIGRISHPGIVTVYDVGQDHDTIYIAMEFIAGRPLNEVIKGRTFPAAEVVAICVQVAEALGYAHRQGITHRDVKPSNIILTPDRHIKLTDFGIARIDDSDATHQTQAGDILGTPVYMAPEQVLGKTADRRTDLYALGIIAYEMVMGRRPFSGGNIAAVFRAITDETPPEPMPVGGNGNRELAALIMKSLAKSPADRFQSGEEMAAALNACLAIEATAFPEVVATPPPRSRRAKHRLGAALVVLLLAAGAGGYALLHGPSDPHTTAGSSPARPAVALSTLSIDSAPSGAQVFVDTRFKGTTPLEVQLVPGTYEVRLDLPDHYQWEARIRLTEEKPTALNVRLVAVD